MQFKSTLLAAALSASVAANFVIVTRPPFVITDLNFASQANNFKSEVASRISQLTASVPASELSRAASAQSALVNFVATAPSSLSIPAKVTELGSFETFSSTPAWFAALPSDLKSFYEGTNAKVQSAVDAAAGVSATPSRASVPSPSNTGAANSDKLVQYMGAAGAAAVAGIFAL